MSTFSFVYFVFHITIVGCIVNFVNKGCWPNNIIPYVINEVFTKDQVALIERHVAELRQFTCITWVNVFKVPLNNTDYVQFRKSEDPTVCHVEMYEPEDGYAMMHIVMGDQCFLTIQTKYEILIPVVMQLMLQVMGMSFEQQRADRDCYVIIHKSAISLQRGEDQFAIRSVPWMERFPYDKSSVMHHPRSIIIRARTEHYSLWSGYEYEPLGSKGDLSFLDKWKLLYRFCKFPHYCDFFPQLCVLMDDLEKGCAKPEEFPRHHAKPNQTG